MGDVPTRRSNSQRPAYPSSPTARCPDCQYKPDGSAGQHCPEATRLANLAYPSWFDWRTGETHHSTNPAAGLAYLIHLYGPRQS